MFKLALILSYNQMYKYYTEYSNKFKVQILFTQQNPEKFAG